jgi:hypothetical protein
MRQAQLRHSSQQSHDGMVHAPRLQRKCACGGTCAGCAEDRRLRRTAANGALGAEHAPPIVHDALRSQGRPLDDTTRAYMEPRFGHDFSRVRVHSGDTAARSAAAVNARAYTVGQHIVLGGSAPSPATREGRSLLAHELTHVVQQRDVVARSAEPIEIGQAGDAHERDAETLARAVVADQPVTAPDRRSGLRLQASLLDSVVDTVVDVLAFIPRLFGASWFTSNELREYLDGLRRRHAIEDNMFSDNKARACVDRESEFGPYDVAMKTLLVREMTTGHVSFLDEGSTITLLRRAQVAERLQIVNAIGRDLLWSKFSGGNRRILEALTMTAADANDALVGRLRTLTPDQLQDYQQNVTDPALQAIIQRAAMLQRITAPVPDAALPGAMPNGVTLPGGPTPQTAAVFQINGVPAYALPDIIDPSLGKVALTDLYVQFAVTELAPPEPNERADMVVGDLPPPEVRLFIRTRYGSPETESGPSAYGAGTRPGDPHTVHFHEQTHGETWFRFIRENPPPGFTGQKGMSRAQYTAAVTQWNAAMADWSKKAAAYSEKMTHCVGTFPTAAMLAGTGLPVTICTEQPAGAGR